ncbi:uncharacterized protein LOC105391256 isoform X1 [Plutella xylostella]|uniref:uncharacterized protein LOC105391256 isoform X1 n=1 Tax=Plutella xylostella TaxID=51655 RepID=UPI002032A78E|nr:uncharacterized protein LOC105391256 isoform X1 [Plutella xylostella]
MAFIQLFVVVMFVGAQAQFHNMFAGNRASDENQAGDEPLAFAGPGFASAGPGFASAGPSFAYAGPGFAVAGPSFAGGAASVAGSGWAGHRRPNFGKRNFPHLPGFPGVPNFGPVLPTFDFKMPVFKPLTPEDIMKQAEAHGGSGMTMTSVNGKTQVTYMKDGKVETFELGGEDEAEEEAPSEFENEPMKKTGPRKFHKGMSTSSFSSSVNNNGKEKRVGGTTVHVNDNGKTKTHSLIYDQNGDEEPNYFVDE